jgi:hypothetical protein
LRRIKLGHIPWEKLKGISWKELPWSLIAGAAVTAAVLLFCALLPGRFIQNPEGSDPEPEVSLSRGARRDLWAAYQAGTLTESSVVNTEGETLHSCKALAEKLRSQLILDKSKGNLTSSGEECVRISGVLDVFHYWREWTGDWGNWLEIYIDLETREVYYFYASSGCKQNFESYADVLSPDFDAAAAAVLWGKAAGLGEPTVSRLTDEGDGQVLARYGDMRYIISVVYYYDAGYPSILYDLKVTAGRVQSEVKLPEDYSLKSPA